MEKKTKEQKKTPQEIEATLKAKLNRWFEAAVNNRKKIDWMWFIFDLWKEGHHYAKWDKNTEQIITTQKSNGVPKVMVNKIESTVRAVVNYALRNRPKAEVTPADLTRNQIGEIVKQNAFLDYMHDKLGLRGIERGAVEESTTSGIAWVQILWDENAEDGKGQIKVNEVDKYDLYWSPNARTPEESQYMILAVSRQIPDLKKDPMYKDFTDWDKVKADATLSSSTLKERLLRLESGEGHVSGYSKQDGSVIVKEFWCYGDEDLGQEKGKIYVTTMAGGEIIRQPELTDLKRFPFFRLCTSRKKLSMVGKSWVKNLIPLNRRLNHLMSSLAEYNVLMNKAKIIADKGAGVRVINNEHGQVIEKKRGYDVTTFPVAQISSMIIQEIETILRLFEDISSVHDATMGRIPAGAKSGKALEALQVGDSNNLSEVVENTEIWLEEIYEYILSLAAEKYQFARQITPVSSTTQRDFISVVGEDAPGKPEGAVVLRKKNVVDVKITSYLAHTAEARREAIQELASIIPDLDPQTILEVYEIGPIADIVKRIKQNREERMALEAQQEEVKATAGQPSAVGAQQAIADIKAIINGQVPQPPMKVDQSYIDYIDQFLQSPEGQGLGEDVIGLIEGLKAGSMRGMNPQMRGGMNMPPGI